MSLRSLPDFSHAVAGGGHALFALFERSQQFAALPAGLELARRPRNEPDFRIELVRGQNPRRPPEPHGWLQFALAADYDLEDALAHVRRDHASAAVHPVPIAGGFLRFTSVTSDVVVPRELAVPTPLSSHAPGGMRFVARLAQEGAELVVRGLEQGMLPYLGVADLEVVGVAARSPLEVQFEPRTLLERIHREAGGAESLSWAALVDLFRNGPATLALETSRPVEDSEQFAQAMADRVRSRFGRHVPAPAEAGGAHVALDAELETGNGSFRWDLSRPMATRRPLQIRTHPLQMAVEAVREGGMEAVVERTEVRSIQTGEVVVRVRPNLPRNLVGVLELGATLSAPAQPPDRPSALVKTVQLLEVDDAAEVRFQLSPREEPSFQLSTFAVVRGSSGIQQLTGEETTVGGESVLLGLDAFPFAAVAVEATAALLKMAEVEGICRWRSDPHTGEESFRLSLEAPEAVIAGPREAEEVHLDIEARPTDGGDPLRLEDLPLARLRLDLASFPGYGPHTVPVECRFTGDLDLYAIELQPEAATDDERAPSVLHFTPDRNRRQWSYFAESPFRPGYRIRTVAPETGEWSEPKNPFDPLVLEAIA